MTDQYFNTLSTAGLCRAGGNGPFHPSQIEGLSLVEQGESLLDVGCGSGTTTECIVTNFPDKNIIYKGVDAVEAHTVWCKEQWPQFEFEQENGMKLKEKDQSWDVVWSRHVVDHMPSVEEALTEYMRVAKKKVICILWYGMNQEREHKISHVNYEQEFEEYLNSYSEPLIAEFLEKQEGWDYRMIKYVGLPHKQNDTIIYLKRR